MVKLPHITADGELDRNEVDPQVLRELLVVRPVSLGECPQASALRRGDLLYGGSHAARGAQLHFDEGGGVVTDGDEVDLTLGAPDVLVHNALADFSFNGEARSQLDRLTWDEITVQAETAVGGALNCLQALLPHWQAQGFGRMITIGTNLLQNPVVPYHDYTAAKGALLALTRTAAKELGPMGVNINMVSGGLLRTTDASRATPEAVFDIVAAQTPLGRVTTPEDLADAALFFASPWARAVTGQNLVVDGGLVFG